MRALLIATGFHMQLEPMVQHRPSPLFQIVDKPIIVHIIEFLHSKKINKIDLLLHHLPEQIEEYLGNGDRWGVKITYHLTNYPVNPFRTLTPILQGWKENVILIGRGDQMPNLEEHSLQEEGSLLFYFPSKDWTGWGILPRDSLTKISEEIAYDSLPHALETSIKHSKTAPYLSTVSFQDLLLSQKHCFSAKHKHPLFPTTAHQVESQLWISRGVVIHPTASIKPPCYLGLNCQISEGAQIGPNAIIESHCIIDKNSKVHDSVICQNSYVGDSLDINSSIVDKNLLINLNLATALRIREDFILSEIEAPSFAAPFIALFEKGLALVMFLLLLPVYIYLNRTCSQEHIKMLLIPTSQDIGEWKTFDWAFFSKKDGTSLNMFQNYFKRLPLLLNILKGEIHFIGNAPRPPQEVKTLPKDWQKLYLRSKVGLITLAALDNPDDGQPEEIYASEAYYATQMSMLLDLKLFFRWLWKKVTFGRSR